MYQIQIYGIGRKKKFDKYYYSVSQDKAKLSEIVIKKSKL